MKRSTKREKAAEITPMGIATQEEEKKRLYEASYPLLVAPWHNTQTMIRVRYLSDSVTLACGDFGLIKAFGESLDNGQPPTIEQMNAYATRHDEICKLCLAEPTYDELMEIVGAHVNKKEIERQLAEIRVQFGRLPRGPEKAQLKKEYEALELTSKFLLPANFMAYVVNYALQIDKSDINNVTEDMLLNCAVLASRCHDKPSDHFPGFLTPRMIKEFDNRALVLFDEDQKKKTKNGR